MHGDRRLSRAAGAAREGAGMTRAYYNENDPYAAQWLRNLIEAGHIAPGDVDDRSILDVRPADLVGYTQCHFFAGIGGWSLAARLAGWPDSRPLWSGSCPCQPFSVAGKRAAQSDARHPWPVLFELIRALRPNVFVGEQVAAAVGKDWLDGVYSDLEGIDYACGAAVVPACAVDAPHRRDRLWFMANPALDASGAGFCQSHEIEHGIGTANDSRDVDVANADNALETRQPILSGEASRASERLASGRSGTRPWDLGNTGGQRSSLSEREAALRKGRSEEGRAIAEPSRALSSWGEYRWLIGADGKARRTKPGIRLLAHGVPARVGKLRAYGNAIVPQVGAEILGAYLDIAPTQPRLLEARP